MAAAVRRTTGLAAHVVPPGAEGKSSTEPSLSAAVPVGFSLGLRGEAEDPDVAAHLHWLDQKDALAQDVLLLGPPGALRRRLALRFCEMKQREVEVLAISRDTTEADLKQRRELRVSGAHTDTHYVDAPPVRCALRGRILVLDGLEKAERNVLPTLNNLLENREMALDDGRFLVPGRRYDALQQESRNAADAGAGSTLARVHEAFRVIALAVPCPPFVGNPMDPPLRSRFQARVVVPLPHLARVPQVLGRGGDDAVDALFQRLAALQDAINLHALGDSTSATDASVGTGILRAGMRPPAFTHDALLRVVRLVFPGSRIPRGAEPSLREALGRAYPIELLLAAAGPAVPGSSQAVVGAFRGLLDHLGLQDGHCGVLGIEAVPEETGTATRLSFTVEGVATPLTTRLVSPGLGAPPTSLTEFVELPALARLVAALAQDFVVGHDCLLTGPPGCGKSALARRLAAMFGYGSPGGSSLELFFLYEEMSSRDLLQRRTTDAEGRTFWVDSPLVRAARSGALCILDGLHRLRADVLCVLAPLLQDRQASLALAGEPSGADSELLLRADRYAAVRARRGLTGEQFCDAAAGCRVSRIHPAFRVLALAEPPTARSPWLTEELCANFSHHTHPEPGPRDQEQILAALFPGLPSTTARQLVAAYTEEPAPGGAGQGVPLRVLLRVAGRAASAAKEEPSHADGEALQGVLQQALFPFMPHGEQEELLAKLKMHFKEEHVREAASHALRNRNSSGAAETRDVAGRSDAATRGSSSLQASTVLVGSFVAPLGEPKQPELVPNVDFVGIGRHVELLEELARAMFQRSEKFVLLLGPQGVGKNRVVDHLLQTLLLEREYMQLHRDTTVAQLTVTPVVAGGRLVYEDSPLVRAAQFGRVLVLDEADKAPLEVVVVLKSLVEDGQISLPDGRRLARHPLASSYNGAAGAIDIHPAFRLIVLANRPGFPFLGNDLIREADVFSVFCLDNPDAASELQLVRSIGPSVPEATLKMLVGIFADLRTATEEGRLQYPYSMRELAAVVKHLERFPDDSVESALAAILAFDRFDTTVRRALEPIFEKRGMPFAQALGIPIWEPPFQRADKRWLRAFEVLRKVRLAATSHLGPPVDAGSWSAEGEGQPRGVEPPVRRHRVQRRRVRTGEQPQSVQLSALAFDRAGDSFSESVARAQLRMPDRGGPVVDAVIAVWGDPSRGSLPSRSLHLLSASPATVWTIEDPLAQGAKAARSSSLALHRMALGPERLELPETAERVVMVNGRVMPLGMPQLLWVSNAHALLLHAPLAKDVGQEPLLVMPRPQNQDSRVEALVVQPLGRPVEGGSQATPPRRLQGCFVAVAAQQGRQCVDPEAQGEFVAANCALFFQPSTQLLLQVDVVKQQAREVLLRDVMAGGGRLAGLLRRLRRQIGVGLVDMFAVTAAAVPGGTEVLVSMVSQVDGPSARFLAVHLPAALSPTGVAGRPVARVIETFAPVPGRALKSDAPPPPAVLPALGSEGLVMGSDAGLAFVVVERGGSANRSAPAELLHSVEGGGWCSNVDASTSTGVGLRRRLTAWSEEEDEQENKNLGEALASHRELGDPVTPPLPSIAELVAADDETLERLLMPKAVAMQAPRSQCQAVDAAASEGMMVRALRLPGVHASWLEAVDVATHTVRRLPARARNEVDADVGGGNTAGVARLLPWPALPRDPEKDPTSFEVPDVCVVFRDGSIRWLELSPARLASSLRHFLEVRGLQHLFQDPEPEVDRLDRGALADFHGRVPAAPGIQRGNPPNANSHSGGANEALDRKERSGASRAEFPPEAGDQGLPASGPDLQMDNSSPTAPASTPDRLLLEAAARAKHEFEAHAQHSSSDKAPEHLGGSAVAADVAKSPQTGGGAETQPDGDTLQPMHIDAHERESPKRAVGVDEDGAEARDDEREAILERAKQAAQRMSQEALERRQAEIDITGADYDIYLRILNDAQGEIEQLRRVLGSATARQRERVWQRGVEGELDENRLVDALAGEAAVFKRRAERESRPGEVLLRPKRILFLFDTSSSMYIFNSTDGRLRRSCEAAVMLMEALRSFEHKFDYSICCHDGGQVLRELVPFGRPPGDEKERLVVISKMLHTAQTCGPGDNTLASIELACERVAGAGPADDYFVFAFSDGHLRQYGITGEQLAQALVRNAKVHAVCFLIANYEEEALALSQRMPERVKMCFDLRALPAELRQQFVSSVARGGTQRSAL